jgi:DEAD/DEAH box helicase domain-containing protein
MSINKTNLLFFHEVINNNITCRWKTDPEEAQISGFPEIMDLDLIEILQKSGISGLYDHQMRSFFEIINDKNIILNTGTSSGKTLAFTLPIINYNLVNKTGNALFIFPTKALAADQLNKINGLLNQLKMRGHSFLAEKLDGDTPINKRTAIRNSVNFLFTNPDMLHIGILPHHTLWEQYFSNLKFIVIDEVHTYRGVFGSHFSNLVRRLKRILDFYGSSPSYILTSATISNAQDFSGRLTGEEFTLINNDASPKGERHFIFYNPPIINQELGLRAGMINESIPIIDDLVENKNQVIVFARTRNSVETIIRLLKDHFLGRLVNFHGYRSGYLPVERRAIEDGLRDGSIDLVISTNAMELGIDMGKVDAIIMLGYPGSIASFLQQAGRAGRKNHPSIVILIASSLPLDQFIIRHPEFIRGKSPENALINPDNEMILYRHLKCAIFELPFNMGDGYGDLTWSDIKPFLDITIFEKETIERKGHYFWTSENYPANSISLRSITGLPIKLFSCHKESKELIGEIDYSSAKKMVFPGAIYVHDGDTYRVTNLDLEESKAELMPDEIGTYTEPKLESNIEVLQVITTVKENDNYKKLFGNVKISEKTIGYTKYLWNSREIIKSELLELPCDILETTACWIQFSENFVDSMRENGGWLDDPNDYGKNWNTIREQVKKRDKHQCRVCSKQEDHTSLHVHHIVPFKTFSSADEANKLDNLVTLCQDCHRRAEVTVRLRSGLSGIAYIMTNLAPIFLMCASHDIGTFYDPSPKSLNHKPTILFYDQYPGGVGLASGLFDLLKNMLTCSIEFIANCPCLDGCPSCIGPSGENGMGAKSYTLELIKRLMGLNE